MSAIDVFIFYAATLFLGEKFWSLVGLFPLLPKIVVSLFSEQKENGPDLRQLELETPCTLPAPRCQRRYVYCKYRPTNGLLTSKRPRCFRVGCPLFLNIVDES